MFRDREHSTGASIVRPRLSRRLNMLGTILLIVLILLLVGALPTWPYSGGWGYYPSSGLGLVVVVVLVLVLMGRV
jgi:drug/metabolite transporter (DMT)-like permease